MHPTRRLFPSRAEMPDAPAKAKPLAPHPSPAQEVALDTALGKAIAAYRDQYGDEAVKSFIRGYLNCTVY